LGPADQKDLFSFARNNMPIIGYKQRVQLLYTQVPGLGKSGKILSSDPLSKIELDETNKSLKTKVNAAFSVDGEPTGNVLLFLLELFLFPLLEKQSKPFTVPRPEKYGGPMEFKTYASVVTAFTKQGEKDPALFSVDLKLGVTQLLTDFLTPLRDTLAKQGKVYAIAYPSPKELKQKATTTATPASQPAAATESGGISALEIRVGKIIAVEKHKNADSLYVEQIDLGEAKPRTIVSGLVKYVTKEQLQDRLVLVCTNLAPADLKGVTSEGMVLAASTKDKSSVALVDVPTAAKIGERVQFEGETGEPDLPHISKGKLQKLLKLLSTSSSGVAQFKDKAFSTSAGVCTSSLKDATVG